MNSVFDSIELTMLRIVDHLLTRIHQKLVMMAISSFEGVTVQRCCILSYSLLSFNVRDSMDSKALLTRKYSVVL